MAQTRPHSVPLSSVLDVFVLSGGGDGLQGPIHPEIPTTSSQGLLRMAGPYCCHVFLFQTPFLHLLWGGLTLLLLPVKPPPYFTNIFITNP